MGFPLLHGKSGRAQGDEPKGTNQAQTQIFADFHLFLENKAFGKCRFSQKTADFRRKPQKTAGTRRKPQIGVRPLRFVPSSAARGNPLPDLPFALFREFPRNLLLSYLWATFFFRHRWSCGSCGLPQFIRETKDTVRVYGQESFQECLFTRSSKVTSCVFGRKRVRLSDLLE